MNDELLQQIRAKLDSLELVAWHDVKTLTKYPDGGPKKIRVKFKGPAHAPNVFAAIHTSVKKPKGCTILVYKDKRP